MFSLKKILLGLPFFKPVIQRTLIIFKRLIGRRKSQALSTSKFKNITFEEDETFFGYYDCSPINSSGSHLIFHSSSYPTFRKPSPKKLIKILLKEIKSSHVKIIDYTSTYNWQQGSRLQWISSTEFIYNTYDKNENFFKSKSYDIKTNKYSEYNLPIQSSFKKKYFLSIDIVSLTKNRIDYGYRNKTNKSFKKDGIWMYDFQTKKSIQIISIKEIIKLNHKNQNNNINSNWINHIMISPKGGKFIFLHRFLVRNIKKDRLVLFDFDKRTSTILVEDLIISHYNWINEEKIICFMGKNRQDLSYKEILVSDGSFKNTNLFGDFNKLDGHPSYKNGTYLTDTYPDKFGYQKLLVHNKKEIKVIGEFYHPLIFFKETRCDLHPRIFKDLIFIDRIVNGKRFLSYTKLNS